MYDLIIVGGGVAAFTSALFAARRGLKILVIGKDIGGQANYTDLIENFPGIEATGGYELVSSIKSQAEYWGIEVLQAEVSRIKQASDSFVVQAYQKQYKASAIILAFGKTPRDLGVTGEEELKGKGISYCASCDMPLYKKKIVTVAGVGDINLDAIILASKFAKKAYALSKTDKLSGHPALIKAVSKKKNVEMVPFVQILSIKGKDHVEELRLKNIKTDQQWTLKTDGLFVELGYIVHSGFVRDLVATDEQGQIMVNDDQSTSVPGIFAAGDVTNGPYKQAVISAGEAANAALAAYDWLQQKHGARGLTSDWTQIKKVNKS